MNDNNKQSNNDNNIIALTLDELQYIISNKSDLPTKLKHINELIALKFKHTENEEKKQAPLKDIIPRARKKSEYYKELLDIIHDLNSDLTLSDLLEKILDACISIIQAERGIILLYNKEGKLEVKTARNNNKENLTNFKFSDTIITKVLKEGHAVLISDVINETNIARSESIIDLELRSIMCAPLGKKNLEANDEHKKYPFLLPHQILGIIYLDNKNKTDDYKMAGNNLELFQAFADQASIALLNAMLYEKVNIDNLTGLYLRQYFEQTLETELQYAHTTSSHLSILMVDIDFFKFVNDKYGHQVGDEVLKMLGRVFRKNLRAVDTCGRFGGEEFIIILPNTPPDQAAQVSEKLRNIVKHTKFSCGTITISIGIANYPIHYDEYTKEETAKELVKLADQALYCAKNNGRDRFEIWNESMGDFRQIRTTITDILTGNPIRDYRNVQMLLEVIKIVTAGGEHDQVLTSILDLLVKHLEADRGMIMLYDEKNDSLKIELCRDKSGKKIHSDDFKFCSSVINKVFETGEEICIHDVLDEIASQSVLELELMSIMCAPLVIEGQRIGLIYIDSKSTVKEFTRPELSYFNAIARHVSMVIKSNN